MATKTKDIKVNIKDFTTQGLALDANKKTAVRIDELDTANIKDLEISIINENLEISYEGKKIIVANYKNIKYIKTDYKQVGKKETYELFDIITNNAVDNTSNTIIEFDEKKLTASGTNYNDKIDLSLSDYTPTGKNIKTNKGITFDGKHGSDILVGTDYNDIFKGGNGNDKITGSLGNDTITGGIGLNTINYTFGALNGNDVINLTKGENFVLNIDGANISELKFKYANNNKDLVIYKSETESITLKNFAYKDVTNNSTKKTENTSSVIITDGTDEIDLRKDFYLTNDSKISVEKNFTGTWLNEEIDASSASLGKNNKGVTIKGNGGNDKITGSLGNDTITAGVGENTIFYSFKNQSGIDVINLTKNEVLHLDVEHDGKLNFSAARNKKDLEITVDNNPNSKLIIKNYYSKVTGATVLVNGVDPSKDVCFNPITSTNYFEVPNAKLQKNYTGSALADEVNASEISQPTNVKKNSGVTIKTGAGDDIITGSNYNDTITAGIGENTIFASSGHDIINLTKGEILNLTFSEETAENIVYSIASNKKDLEITLKNDTENSKKVTLKNYYSKEIGATVLINGKNLAEEFGFEEINSNNYFEATSKIKKSYTGSALADNINANNLSKATNTKKGTGVTINGKGGNDSIIGSKFKDVIKGGNGNDIIEGGLDNDKLYGEAGKNIIKFNAGDGADTIYSGKGEDTVAFENEKAVDITFEIVKKDLVIHYGNNDSVTIKNYFIIKKGEITGIKSSVVNITTEEGTFNIEEVRNGTAFITGKGIINGTEHTNLIFGSDENDTITGQKGNDYITGAEGQNTYIFNTGDGSDTISSTSNEDKIKYNDVAFNELNIQSDGNNVILSNDDDKVVLKNAIKNELNITVEDKNENQYNLQAGTGTINGTDSIDYIISGNENDIINAGKGDDIINAGSGSNTFVFANGDGNDVISNNASDGILKFLDSSYDDLNFSKLSDKEYKVTYNNGQDSVTFNIDQISHFIVKDENESSGFKQYSTVSDMQHFVIGDGVNSNLTGTDLKDIFIGSSNNETMTGGPAANEYRFSNNGGSDTIVSTSNEDTIKFTDSNIADLSFNVSGNDLVISYSDNDSVVLKDYLINKQNISIADSINSASLAQILANNGIVVGSGNISGTDNSDSIFGSSDNDIINAGKGDDIINAGSGSNTFVFANGDGNDVISNNASDGILKFLDSSYDDLNFSKLSDKEYKVTYNNGQDSVTFNIDQISHFIVKDENESSGFKQYSTASDMQHFVIGDGVNSNLTGTDLKDIFIGSSIDETLSGDNGYNIYVFNTGSGNDTINYAYGNDVIKFNDVKITDITYGEFDLNTNSVTLNYGTSDSVTINGLSTGRNNVVIEDSEGNQYTVIIGDGTNKAIKPNAGENAVFIASTGSDYFIGNTGVNIFTNNSPNDNNTGTATGENIYMITQDQNTSIWANGQNDKIVLNNLELSDLIYTFNSTANYVVITNSKNSQEIDLMYFVTYNVNPTIIDKNGNSTDVFTEIGYINGNIGTSGNNIIYSNTQNAEICGKGGVDIIYVNGGNSTIYTYDVGKKNTTEGSSVTVNARVYSNYVFYAQAEENIINNDRNGSNGTYYAYSDQKTVITEHTNQQYSANSVLNIMNTDDISDKDGVHNDLSIIFNVDRNFFASNGVAAVGDVHIVDSENLSAWLNGDDFKGITIKNNVVETINSADGYTISSTQIAQLAETVAIWLSSKGYNDVQAVLDSGNTEDINALTTYFAQDSNWN